MKHYRTDIYLVLALFFILILGSFLFHRESSAFFSTEKIAIKEAKTITTNTMTFATIKAEGPIYDQRTGRKIATTQKELDQTFRIKEAIKLDSDRYFLLENVDEKKLGYVKGSQLVLQRTPEGIFHEQKEYIVTPKKNFHWLADFAGNSNLSTSSEKNRTYQSRGYYQHYNGQKYLAIFSNKEEFLGYLAEKDTTPATMPAEKMKAVQKYLDQEISSDDFGIYVLSLGDGSVAQKKGNQKFIAASTGKLPILYYTQKMIDEKRIDPQQKFEYIEAINKVKPFSFESDGAGVLQNHEFGEKFSIQTILHWTTYYSDNQGANFLGYYAANKYDQTMQAEISKIIGRTWSDRNPMTPKENALIMQAIYEQNGDLIEELSHTSFDDQRIAKYLPVQVAHKIGDVYDLKHDIAIVYADQPYILSVMTKGDREYEEISKLSKEIYEILTKT